MRFGLLGSLEVLDDEGNAVDLGGSQPRTLLAMLLTANGRIVPVDALIEGIWGERPPGSAGGTLQSYVSRLRRLLEPGRSRGADAKVLVWEPPGYRLDVDHELIDAPRFERLADEGRDLLDRAHFAQGRDVLTEALSLWRGPALAEFDDHEFARGIAARLEERRLVVLEDRLGAELALGRHAAVVAELTQLADQHPLREELRAHLAMALYRSGRQAEALRAIDDLRRTLRDELGVDPSRPIRDLENQILSHDPALDAPTAADLTTPARAAAPTALHTHAPTPVVSTPTPLPDVSQHLSNIAPSQLVGRRHELDQLLAAYDEVTTSRTRFVLVEGEPGIGKSRLLEELGDEASRTGAEVFWGRSHEAGATPAFWPWLWPLRALLTRAGHLLEPTPAALIGSLVSESAAAEPGSLAETSRYPLFEAIAELLERAALDRPLVVLLDDLQWADTASLELVEFLTGRVVGARLLLAGTVRELGLIGDNAVVRALATVARRPGSRRIVLRGVTERDTAELIEQAVGQPAAPGVVRAIHARSEGNPFYIGELARLLAEEGGLGDDEAVQRAGVPASVRDVVRRRLAQLPQGTAELLHVAAVVGRDVPLDVLARTAGVALDQCIDDLEPAFVTRLLVEAPNRPSTFRFSHALVRAVVLDDLSRLRRARYHLRVADALGDEPPDDEAEILAEHLWHAQPLGEGRRTATALERAADVAIRRFAYDRAEGLLARAVELRGRSNERDDLEAELADITRFAAVTRMLYGYHRAAKLTPIARGKDLAERMGRADLLAELLWSEWTGAATSCDFLAAERVIRQLAELAHATGDPVLQAVSEEAWGVHSWHQGRIADACAYLDRFATIDASLGPAILPHGVAVENLLLGRCFHLVVHALAGDVDDTATRATTMATRETAPYPRTMAWMFAGLATALAGDAKATEEAARHALSADPTEHFSFFRAGAHNLLGVSLIDQGDPDAGIAHLRAGNPPRSGVRTVVPYYLARWGVGELRAGHADDAQRRIGNAEALMAESGERWLRPFVVAARAEIDLGCGRSRDEATALLEQAHATAITQGAHGAARHVEATADTVGITLGAEASE